MTGSGLNVAVIGLGFGEDFVPLYRAHPGVDHIGLVDISPERLRRVGERYGIADRYERYEDVLANDTWDAVHILAPVSFHANYSLEALRAGKHCACAVPMGTTLDELAELVQVQSTTGLTYMMMETTVYSREYRAVRNLYQTGQLGTLTMYRGIHIQNLDGYPPYWQGFPPMHYLTHALSPILGLTGTVVQDVIAHGSGTLTPDRIGESGNKFPTEVGLFRLRDHDLVSQATMSFFQTARSYIEGFDIYGSSRSVEWPAADDHPARVFELLDLDRNQPDSGLRGRRSTTSNLSLDNGAELLPEPLRRFVNDYDVEAADGSGTVRRLAEHGGSHPHLVHEFVTAALEGRRPAIDAHTAAAWTAPGICGHQSALAGGERITVPDYRSSHQTGP